MISKINLLPMVVVSWIMIVYLVATGNLHWYLWIFLAIPIIERAILAVVMWLERQILRATAARMMKAFQEQGGGLDEIMGGPHVP